MTKILLAVLTLAAFLYAAWLVILRRHLPDPQGVTGWRRRFRLGTLLFAGFLAGAPLQGGCANMNEIAGRSTEADGESLTPSLKFLSTLQAVWLALDMERGKEFRSALEPLVHEGLVARDVATTLTFAYAELAFHKFRRQATCYFSISRVDGHKIISRERALQQIFFLQKTRDAGTLDPESTAKTEATLIRELDMLLRLERLPANEPRTTQEELQELADAYAKDALTPEPVTKEAVRWILGLESVLPLQPAPKEPASKPTEPREKMEDVLCYRVQNMDAEVWRVTPEREGQILALLDRVEAAGSLKQEAIDTMRATLSHRPNLPPAKGSL